MFRSKDTLDRAFDALIGREIRNLNTHLPKRRRTLNELLKVADPTIEAIAGSSILLKSSELQDLAQNVPQEYHDRVKLPFIILRRMDFGKSVYTVSGDWIEEFTVKKILGMTDLDYHDMYRDKEQTFLYKPHVTELLNRFHSLVVIAFGVPRELADYALSRD